MQYNSSQRQLKLDLTLGQRPLQKSMVQLNSRNSPRSPQNRPTLNDFSPRNLLKNSQISPQDNITSTSSIMNNSQTSFSFSPGVHSYQPILNRENRKSSYLEEGTTSPALKGLLSPIKTQIKYEGNPEDSYRRFGKSDKVVFIAPEIKSQPFQQDQIIQDIIGQIKQRHLPQLLGKLRKQIYDDIYNLRLEFQSLRDQTRLALKKQEGNILEYKFYQATNDNNSKKMANLEKRFMDNYSETDYSNLQKNFFLLQGKFNELSAKVSDHFQLNSQEFDRLQNRFNNQSEKDSINLCSIKSSLPPLMLEYKELFSLKKDGMPHQIIFNTNIYHIDRMGFLLDQNNYYLIDRRGHQIRLQDKHLQILYNNHLIQK